MTTTYPIPDGTILHEIDPALPQWLLDNQRLVTGKMTDDPENLSLTVEEGTAEEVRHCVLKMLNVLLSQTDYAVVKIAEAQALGEDISAMREEYATVISNRRTWRALINSMESTI